MMQSNYEVHPRLDIVFLTVLVGLCTACVSSPRSEPAGSAAPTSASSNQFRPYAEPPPPAASKDEEHEAKPSEGVPAQQAPVPVPATRRTEPANRPAAAAAPARARGESSKSSSAEKKASGASDSLLSSPDDLRPDPLVPTLADPPDIRTALQDFQGAADMLAASHGCDEGCRAFQSMQRTAARICSLVSNRDPTQRCASARSRVSDAQHDLKDRCGSCAN